MLEYHNFEYLIYLFIFIYIEIIKFNYFAATYVF